MGLFSDRLATSKLDVDSLSDHYILCGAGRTGFHIAEEFFLRHVSFVVVEQNPKVIHGLQQVMDELGGQLYSVEGDATEDETLEKAGVDRAKGLIAAMGDDKDNLFVVLTARSLNPTMRIITRVNDIRTNRGKLLKAGADKVISTHAIGGLRAASEMIRPEVVDFLDQMVHNKGRSRKLEFTEIPASEIQMPAVQSLLETDGTDGGKSALRVKDIGKHTGLLVVAIKPNQKTKIGDQYVKTRLSYHFAPKGETLLGRDDVLVVIGTQREVDTARGINM